MIDIECDTNIIIVFELFIKKKCFFYFKCAMTRKMKLY